MDAKKIYTWYCATILLLCRFGTMLGSSVNDIHGMEASGHARAALYGILFPNQNFEYRNRRESEGQVPGTVYSSNDINIDLSNPDYIHDHHRGVRRIKKVLSNDAMDGVVSLPRNSRASQHRRVSSRSKRFVGLSDSTATAVSDMLLGNSVGEGGLARDDLVKKNLRTKSNMTGLEIKLFQNTMIAALASLCPKVKAEYSELLESVQKSVQNEIRAAYSFLPKKPHKNDKLFLLMKKVSKCSQAFNHKFQHQKNRDEKRVKAEPVKKVMQGRFASIRMFFEEEAKRLALLTQLDVVPSTENIVKLFHIILEKVTKNCLQLHSEVELVSENQRMVGLLISIIELPKDAHYGKQATVHQAEMEEFIEMSRKCNSEIRQ